jgi:hypothetical protein
MTKKVPLSCKRRNLPKNSEAGLVDPAYRFGTGSVDLFISAVPACRNLLNFCSHRYVFSLLRSVSSPNRFLLHHHCQVLKFMHQDG